MTRRSFRVATLSSAPHRVLRAAALSVALLAAAAAVAGDVPISPAARKLFQAGVALLEDREGSRYEEAYRAFKAAYADSPSPRILGNIGLCAMKLERDGEAIESYRRYLAEAKDIDPEERHQIESDLGVLESAAVPIALSVEPAGATVVDERAPVQGASVVNRYGPLAGPLRTRIRAGSHRIRVELDGHEPQRWTVEAQPGKAIEHTFVLAPVGGAAPAPTTPPAPPSTAIVAPPPSGEPPPVAPPPAAEADGPTPTIVWLGLAATGALAIGAGVTGALALAKHSDYEAQFAADGTVADRATAQSLRDTGTTLNVVTDVLAGSAVAAGVVTLVLYVTRPRTELPPSAAWLIGPTASPSGAGLGVRF